MSKVEEMVSKYDELLAKANTINSVGKRIAGMIESNINSIDWYNNRIGEVLGENPDADVSYLRETISELELENKLIADVEKMFWDKYVF